MKLLLFIPFTVFACLLSAQAPINDDCSGIVDLGEVPYCSAAAQFTNVNATTSIVDPLLNVPDCFNNNAERDVWFQFSLPADGSITDISMSVFGAVAGNGTLRMPEIALYRGDCVLGGLAELDCIAAPLNINEVQLDAFGLLPGIPYFLRINDYSASATPNAGTFKLCVEAFVPDFIMGDLPGTQSCSGTLWDSGRDTADYAPNENLTFTICPLDVHQCIQINVLEFSTEFNFDFLNIYEGNGTSGLLVEQISGFVSNQTVNVSGGGCATLEFQSDGSLQFDGFQLTWQCSQDICPAPPPVPPAAADCASALSINGCNTVLPNTIVLEPGQGDPDFIVEDVNAGCILGPSQNLNFAFFYFTAQADGEFGFLVKNGNPANPSDIDFSIWGPIDNLEDICEVVTTTQPVRSSWTAAPSFDNPEGLTGLTNVDPYSGAPITDEFDCGGVDMPGTGFLPTDDGFVKTLTVQQGKIYVVFLDDYDGAVESSDGISIDFSGSTPGVLDGIPGETVSVSDDVTICLGQSTPLSVVGGLDYAWAPNSTLSCDQCPNPIALPTEMTTYVVQVATVCSVITDSVTVSFLDLDLGPDANVCLGASFTLNENAFPGDYAWFGSQGLDCYTCPSPTFTATAPGIYTLLCIITTPFCSDTDIVRINVATGLQPVLNITSDTSICVGESVTLGGPSTPLTTYAWASNPPGFSSSDSAPPPVAPVSSTTYYLTATSTICPFPGVDSVVVTVYKRPVLSVIDGATFCFGDSAVLGNTTFQPFVSYLWSPNDGSLSDTTSANPVATPIIPGLQVYSVTASNPGCSITSTIPVNAVDLQLSFNVADSILLCKGSAQEILATVFPPGAASVIWNPLQQIQLSPDGLTATVSPEDNFTYTATVTVPGCTRSKKVFVKVDSLPQFLGIAPLDTSICIGSIVLLKYRDDEPLYEPSLFPEMTFLWTPGDGQITTDTLPFLYVQPTDTVVYTRITVNGGCADTVTATVNVIEPPEMNILPEVSTICPDSMILLTATAPGVDSLMWTPAGSLTCDDCLTPVATPLSSTTYTLSGKFKGCPVATSALVNVIPRPIYQFPSGTIRCSGDSLLLNLAQDPNPAAYTWTSNPPSSIPSIAQPTVALQSTGVNTITYYLEVDNGCPVQDSFTVVVTGVELSISAPDTICPNSTKLINALTSVPGGQFTWSEGSTTQGISVSPDSTTTYTVNYELNGCAFQDSVTITISGETPDILFPTDNQLCPGDSIVLNSVATQGATYSWISNVGGFTSQEAIPPVQVMTNSTTYTVTATSVDGCTITKTLPVTVFNASLSVSNDLVVCAGETFSVSGTGTATGAYSWTPGNISSPSFTETLNNEQIIQYGLLYTYGTPGNECFLTDTVTVQVLRDFAIKIVADPDSVYNVGEAVMLDAVIQPSQILTGFTFSWLENNTLPIGNTQEITVTSQTTENTIAYTVTVVSPNGCSQVETIVMRVLQPKVEIPNAFTPNGDGSNDAFRLAIIEGVVVLERLEVYNRWGQKVYESTDAAAEWDGRTDGKDAPSDVYVYKIRYRRGDGSLVLDSGEVTLLR